MMELSRWDYFVIRWRSRRRRFLAWVARRWRFFRGLPPIPLREGGLRFEFGETYQCMKDKAKR